MNTPASFSRFDAIRFYDENGTERWSARTLMVELGYATWDKFYNPLARAERSMFNTDGPFAVQDHFSRSGKMIDIGKGATRPVEDYHLSRLAAYLVAMNGDPNKIEVADAQRYFAEQTRRAELAAVTPAAPVAVMPTHSEALRGWADALEEGARKDRVIEQITPAAQAWDQFLNSDQDYSVREAAQILCRDKAIRIGEGRLFAYLRGARWIDSNNEPMQTQVNAKRLFRKADYKRNHKTGWEGETWQVRITPKGLGELHKLLGGQQSLNTLVWPELGLRVVGS